MDPHVDHEFRQYSLELGRGDMDESTTMSSSPDDHVMEVEPHCRPVAEHWPLTMFDIQSPIEKSRTNATTCLTVTSDLLDI